MRGPRARRRSPCPNTRLPGRDPRRSPGEIIGPYPFEAAALENAHRLFLSSRHGSREVARDGAAVDLAQPWLLRRADVLDERAAGAEAAAARHVARAGRLALEREVERDAAAADAWHGRQQRARVRVARRLEHGGRVAQLDDRAEVH